MNTHFGQLDFGCASKDDNWIARIASLFLKDAPKPPCTFVSGAVSALYREFEPTKVEASSAMPEGSIIFWDGRLDNACELLSELGLNEKANIRDVDVAALGFRRWGTDAFRKMLGDWSFVVWEPLEQSLTLAKDPIGTRPLFYQFTANRLRWGTALEWLVEAADSPTEINFEYLAGWLSLFPAAEMTPYESIEAVPASTFVRFTPGKKQVQKYWEFAPGKQIQYRSDAEYDEHFRDLLAQSIRRRLRANGPMLAELSGGMDSSSIVCLADAITSKAEALAPRLDTISYFDDSEPNWNERPYFERVEQKRGRAGFHIALDLTEDLDALFAVEDFVSTPAECVRRSPRNEAVRALAEAHGYVGLLSGTGGDEFTGGVPTAQPELADLLSAGRLLTLASRLRVWGLSQRRPWMHLLLETVASFLPSSWRPSSRALPRPIWLNDGFVTRYSDALAGYDHRLHVLGPRPSFQENLSVLSTVRSQLACSLTTSRVKLDKRYPYLDRDLLEFLFAVPRHQLAQPGRRRALMRRALAGIVPDEILTRKRKAFVARAPRAAINARWDRVASFANDMVAEALGIVSSKPLQQTLLDVRSGNDVPVQPVLRALALEKWLRNLVKHGRLSLSRQTSIVIAKPSVVPQGNQSLSSAS